MSETKTFSPLERIIDITIDQCDIRVDQYPTQHLIINTRGRYPGVQGTQYSSLADQISQCYDEDLQDKQIILVPDEISPELIVEVNRLTSKKAQVCFANLKAQGLDYLDCTGFDQVFAIFDNVQEAIDTQDWQPNSTD